MPKFNANPRLRLTHWFALIVATFAVLTVISAVILWTQVDSMREAQADIIHRQYPTRLAIAEAKSSEAVFNALASQLLNADADQARDLSRAVREEAKRFRSWMATAQGLAPGSSNDVSGISARFEKMLGFIEDFSRLDARPETREFRLENRFGPLRDDPHTASTRSASNR